MRVVYFAFACCLSALTVAAFLPPTLQRTNPGPALVFPDHNSILFRHVKNPTTRSVNSKAAIENSDASIIELTFSEIQPAPTVQNGGRRHLKQKAKRLLHSANQALLVSLFVFSLMVSPVAAKGGGGHSNGGRSSSGRSSMSRSSTYRSSASNSRPSNSSPYRPSTSRRSSNSSSSKGANGKESFSTPSSSSSRSSSGPPKVYSSKPRSFSSSSNSPPATKLSPPSTKTKTLPPSTMQRHSSGRLGGRVKRGNRNQDTTKAPIFNTSPSSPSSRRPVSHRSRSWSSPRRPSTVHHHTIYQPAPSQSHTSVVVEEPPIQEIIVVQDRVLEPQPLFYTKPIDTQSSTTSIQAMTPSSSTTLVNGPNTVRRNPWPERLAWASAGGLTTAAWYERQKQASQSRLPQSKDWWIESTQAVSGWQAPNISSLSTTSIDPGRDSGMYTGVTIESDGTEQEVETFLDFLKNGKIEGIGFDEEDGPYRIRGTWRGLTGNWKEIYENYSVRVKSNVRQPYLPPGPKILDCTFVSSIGNIKGSFELQKKSK